jgi:hypothetical protein
MKFKTLLLIIAVVITIAIFSLPAGTYAEQVPWTSIEYSASAKAEIIDLNEDYQETIGPPLPIDAYAYVNSGQNDTGGSSHVDSSIIDINTWAHSCG